MDVALNYRVLEILYENSDILVFRAELVSDHKRVIIKTLKSKRPSLESLSTLRHEFQVNQSLDIKGIVRCQELIDLPNQHLLIFEDVGGVSLKEFLNSKALDLNDFFPIAIEITRCLADLHESKIVHKDIKPDNLLIDPETLKIRLLDLSLASQLSIEHQDVSSSQKLEGSLPYISPEQTGRMNRPIDYRTDYYSLGITFYEMLTGSVPFHSSDPLEYIHFHLAIEAKPISKVHRLVPEMLSKLVAKLMSKSAEDRYQSAAGIIWDLSYCFKEWKAKQAIPEFQLGQGEVLDHLTLSTKLYGRELEVNLLLSGFEKARGGALECLMITGYSGIGKTTLVNELHRPIIAANGHLISGKFDQLQKTTPYTAFTTAFSKLFQLWLTEPEEKLNVRKDVILKTLGNTGQVIMEFIPDLEKIIGAQPDVDRLGAEQAQNRFLNIFQKFIGCIASVDEPLVIFIDDLQWIDQASLRLLDILLTLQDARSILFIGAYRDNEVDEFHPLTKAINTLKNKQVSITDILLTPLDLEQTNAFVADTLRMEPSSSRPLAEILFAKTAGNPFFAKEFIKECYGQNFLYFSSKESQWRWDLDKITNMPGSSNVVDLMLGKISKLPSRSQKLIQYGSCLGMIFDSAILSKISKSTDLEIEEDLSTALKEGLLQRSSDGLQYRFIHDRIQQAAYQTLPEKQKALLHLKIGRLLFKQVSKQDYTNLFDALGHLGNCRELIDRDDEKKQLAKYSLVAGYKAAASGAYQAAYDFYVLGLEWLKTSQWHIDHNLLWPLNLESAEALYLMRESGKALEQCDFLLSKSHNLLEKAKIYRLKMTINLSINKLDDNIEILLEASNAFGLYMETDPSQLSYSLEYLKLRFRFGKRGAFAKHVLDFKRAEDEALLVFSDIFFMGGNSAAFTGRLRFIQLATIQYLYFSEKKGIPEKALFQVLEVFSRYIFLYNNDLNEYRIFYNVCTNLYNSESYSASLKAFFLFRLMRVGGYFLSIKDLLINTKAAIQDLIEVGSFNWLPLATSTSLDMNSFADLSVDEMIELSDSHQRLGRRFQLANILGASRFSLLSHQHLAKAEGVSLQNVLDATPPSPIPFGSMSLFNTYFEEDFQQTKQMAERFIRENKWVAISLALQQCYAVLILTLSKLYKDASASDQKQTLKDIGKYLKQLNNFSDHNPGNFLHLYLIGMAEYSRLLSDHMKAIDYYRQAISVATENGFIRWTAIANERAAELYLQLNDTTAATAYIQEALYYYEQWGCQLKVAIIKQNHADLISLKQAGSKSKTLSTTVLMTGELDLMSMIKANQAISSEIELDKLLPRILRIVTESAGAEKAVFIGLRNDEWMIEAYAEIKNDHFDLQEVKKSLSGSLIVPEGLITYSIRSGEPELIGHMSVDEKYLKLSYVMEHQPKSVLCLPIKRDNKVIAALYLENNLTSNAFTPERVQLLQALSTQIAISVENARYLEHTQELFHATERFVPKKFLQLLGRKNIEEIQIGDAVKVEMSAIFADLRDFTSISEAIEPEELTYILNTYLKYMAPIIRNNNGFINRVLGDGILALFPLDTQDAVQAAIEMEQALPLFNKEINEAGFKSIFMGIGVNTGPAMLCALGEEERIEANVVSDMVNAASRIEGLNKMYGTQLLISDATYQKLSDLSSCCIRKIDVIRVKGKTKAMAIYEVMSFSSYEQQLALNKYITQFGAALSAYLSGDFKTALKEFESCRQIDPDDPVAKLFKTRCDNFIVNPPQQWDGITTMLDK